MYGERRGWKERPTSWTGEAAAAAAAAATDVALLQNTLINDSTEQIYLHY